MTIEIRQLIIRAVVDGHATAVVPTPDTPAASFGPVARNSRPAPLSPTERAAVAADCARDVAREMRRARER